MASRALFVGSLLRLRTLPVFEGLSQRHLATLAQEVEEVTVDRGTALLSPESAAQEIHVVVDGRFSVRREGEERSVGPGEAIGFLELLAQGPSGTEARAETDAVTMRLDGDGLREVCERHFAVLDALILNVARLVVRDRRALRAVVQGDPGAWESPLPVPLDRVGRMLALHRSPAFPSASMDALAELAGRLSEVHLEPGQPLWDAGDPADSFLVLCQGSVLYRSPGGSWTAEVGPGGVPGLPATLARAKRSVAASAVTPVVALRMETEPFLDVLEDHFEMAFGFLGRLASSVLSADRKADPSGPGSPQGDGEPSGA